MNICRLHFGTRHATFIEGDDHTDKRLTTVATSDSQYLSRVNDFHYLHCHIASVSFLNLF